MGKSAVIINICILGLLIISATSALQTIDVETNISNGENEKAVGVFNDRPVKLDITCKPVLNNIKILGVDTQITSSETNEGHPSTAIDYSGNPFLLYHAQEDFAVSDIFIQRSLDNGETWPGDMVWSWGFQDPAPINPDVKFMEDGIRAYATHETVQQEPVTYFHDYENIDDPGSWAVYYFDFSDRATYVAETAICTNGTTTIALGSILDYSGQGYDLEDTLLINWNTANGEGSWPGVFWINEDSEGNSRPRSHLSADAGEKMFFCYQQDELNGKSKIYVAHCKVDENTEYTDWKTSAVAASNRYNCTNPDISVSGKIAYVVYMCDKNGNQDIYVAVSRGGSFWNQYPVATSPEDELYPVISANGEKATCLFIKNGNLYETSTEDSGVTWSTPKQVNDVSNTVVDEFQYVDIAGTYGVWTDERNENNDIYFETVGLSPILTIDKISGGFGVQATISNVGNAPAEDVKWSIDINGLILLGGHTEGTETLTPGASKTVKSGFIFGFGKASITVTFGDVTKTAEGFVLGPLVLGVK
ncbi:MAG TPA: hypothetical protein ENI49_05510 [Thermoplasmatales archaeon]|nr:hypothetical protein [Thermoplasmatales archaeon]